MAVKETHYFPAKYLYVPQEGVQKSFKFNLVSPEAIELSAQQ